MGFMYKKSAVISPCQTYRYRLDRVWDDRLPVLAFIMLNPSTADAKVDDPTIRRCLGFAKRDGYGGIVVVNLFALRATNPLELLAADDPVGPENDQAIVDAVAGNFTLAAWGASVPKKLRSRVGVVRDLLSSNALDLNCLGVTGEGHPRHPLFVPASTAVEKFQWA